MLPISSQGADLAKGYFGMNFAYFEGVQYNSDAYVYQLNLQHYHDLLCNKIFLADRSASGYCGDAMASVKSYSAVCITESVLTFGRRDVIARWSTQRRRRRGIASRRKVRYEKAMAGRRKTE